MNSSPGVWFHRSAHGDDFADICNSRRYITRPALCLDRLSTNAAGQVVYALKNPYRDGTTHVLFSPQDFVARLAALVPRPRINLTRYHGVFAPSSPMRRAIVPTPANHPRRRKPKDVTAAQAPRQQQPPDPPSDSTAPPTAPLTWAERLKRVFEIDITLCPLCGGQLRIIGDITDPDLIRGILDDVVALRTRKVSAGKTTLLVGGAIGMGVLVAPALILAAAAP